ncbi:MAG: MBL fold metallo-hydrolase [Patescibacteria group bacterium]|nr:MBL fold metallo-hydrolase [Patescibacteria group bacterium]
MKVTKLGHCAMIVEHEGVTLLTDPGSFTAEAQEKVTGLDAVLITHEHQDHYHVDSLKKILANNPTALVVGNTSMAKLIGEQIADTQVVVVGDGQSTMVKSVLVEGFGSQHALVYPPDAGLCENTGYFIGDKLYFPGDNFYNPGKKIDVLALPVAGPWMKIADAVDFAKLIAPRVAFGVHDGMTQPFFRGFVGMLLNRFVPAMEYVSLQDGESKEF